LRWIAELFERRPASSPGKCLARPSPDRTGKSEG
jgi:hypothetical protein